MYLLESILKNQRILVREKNLGTERNLEKVKMKGMVKKKGMRNQGKVRIQKVGIQKVMGQKLIKTQIKQALQLMMLRRQKYRMLNKELMTMIINYQVQQ